MHIEIERKFLLKQSIPSSLLINDTLYTQGYLHKSQGKTIRVRVAGAKAYLTIKGKKNGFSKPEFEYEIPVSDAEELLLLCEYKPIRKTRYVIPYAGHNWEVDFFYEENEGLIMAEIELASEDEKFELPDWIGEEVTQDFRYYNSYLFAHPYQSWK